MPLASHRCSPAHCRAPRQAPRQDTGTGMLICPSCTHPDQPVLGLKLLGRVQVIVDEAKARALATTKLRLQAEDEDGVQVLDVVHLGQLLPQLLLHAAQRPWSPGQDS